MGNWVSRPGTEGGWETVWDESAPATPATQAQQPSPINFSLTGAAPSNYRASSLGDYAVNEYLRSLEFTDQLGNPGMRQSPYISDPLNPGGAGLSEDQRRALYYGMMSANDPILGGIINGAQNGQGGAYIPEGFDYNNNIYLAPRVDDSGIGEWLGILGTFGGLAGGAGLISGALAGGAGAAGLGGFDAFTAADMAAGDAMLGGMGQDYGSFLNSLGGASGASVTPSIPSTPSLPSPPSVPASGGVPAVSPSSGGSMNFLDAVDAADAVQGSGALNNMGLTYDQFLQNPAGSSWLTSLLGNPGLPSTVRSALTSAFNGTGGPSSGMSGSALGGLLGALTASMGGAQQTGTQTTIQDIPDWQKPYVTQAMQGAQTAYQNSTPSSLLAPAEQQMLQTIQGNYLNPASNPYLRDTFDQAAKAMSDSYLTTTQPRTDSLFGRSGQAFGGNSGYQETVARNQLGFGQNLKNLATDIYGGNYTRERQNQVGATQNAPGFATNQVGANFAPVNNYATIAGQRTGSQTSTPLYENRAGQALYGGLLGSQIFR